MIEIELDGKKVEVQEGSMVMHAADKAGIRPGDVIIRFNGREVPRSASLASAISPSSVSRACRAS